MRIVEPKRSSHTYIQHLVAPPDTVFPLLCPVRERDWVNGWDPGLVVTASGFAESQCVFLVGPAGAEAIWTVTAYDPPHRIEFVKVTPGETVCHITIALEGDAEGGTAAEVTYSYTAISKEGGKVVDAFTADHYLAFMERWENELNHYLRTGEKAEAEG